MKSINEFYSTLEDLSTDNKYDVLSTRSDAVLHKETDMCVSAISPDMNPNVPRSLCNHEMYGILLIAQKVNY